MARALLFLMFMLLLLVESSLARQPIKIVTGTPNPTPSPVHTVRPSARREPGAMSGPAALAPLAGRCFSVPSGIYTFELCVFRNVTQRETHGGHASFFGILGVWGAWLAPTGEPPRFATQLYDDGQDCPNAKRRTTTVVLACGTEHRLSDAREPTTCEYTLRLSAPEACGDAALLAAGPTIAAAPAATDAAAAAEVGGSVAPGGGASGSGTVSGSVSGSGSGSGSGTVSGTVSGSGSGSASPPATVDARASAAIGTRAASFAALPPNRGGGPPPLGASSSSSSSSLPASLSASAAAAASAGAATAAAAAAAAADSGSGSGGSSSAAAPDAPCPRLQEQLDRLEAKLDALLQAQLRAAAREPDAGGREPLQGLPPLPVPGSGRVGVSVAAAPAAVAAGAAAGDGRLNEQGPGAAGDVLNGAGAGIAAPR